MSSIPTPPSYPPRTPAQPTPPPPSAQLPVFLIGWIAGGLMVFNGLVGMTQEKSAIHQIYTTLNLGFGAQLVLMGFAMKEKN